MFLEALGQDNWQSDCDIQVAAEAEQKNAPAGAFPRSGDERLANESINVK